MGGEGVGLDLAQVREAALKVDFADKLKLLQEADAAPTPAALETAETLRGQVAKALAP